MNRRTFIQSAVLGLGGALPGMSHGAPSAQTYDVVVYGGTAAGVVAAVAASRAGCTVALLEPGSHLGGMVSGGLSHSDTGVKETIGGLALEFFKRVGRRYHQPVAWDFEPHVAEGVFVKMANEAQVKVCYGQRLRQSHGVVMRRPVIRELLTESGARFAAREFIDASYEGDLLAQAGVSFTWGREGRAKYGESYAGVRTPDPYAHHRFDIPISAYGPHKKLLPDISRGARGKPGAGDRKVQAYNFRLCMSKIPDRSVPIPEPSHYDSKDFALLARLIEAETGRRGRPPRMSDLVSMAPLPGGKVDVNNNGAFSTDYIGASWAYPNASYRQREAIWNAHADYTAGFFYFLSHDPAVPQSLREEVGQWGLAADEFSDSNHWPPQLYVREARRMIGGFVMTQRDALTSVTKPDPIGVGSYNIDSHNVQRFAQSDGTVQNEGDLELPTIPYQISYRVLVPKAHECANLLVPVCTSASHVGYGTLRLEPVFMIMGHAAGVAAKMAMDGNCAVQSINTRELTRRLVQQHAVTEWSSRAQAWWRKLVQEASR